MQTGARLAGLTLALGLLASLADAQSNYATPYFFTTLAGVAGTSGSTDGSGSAARFFTPTGVAVDRAGNVYVGDLHNHVIRKITPFGVVTTFAGLAGVPGTVINGTGSAARFNSPRGVAVDSAGNVYVADSQNYAIRKITPDGVVTTLAGGIAGGVDGTGAIARFISPYGVAVDLVGNVYVADAGNSAIRKVTPGGVVTTLAGLIGTAGNTDGTGSAARFSNPFGVAVDPSGNVYVADRDSYKIRKITPAGVVTTMAGVTNFITADTDGTGSAARFAQVVAVAADASGNVYVADSTNSSIRKVTTDGVATTLAGLTRSVGSADGTGSVVRFNTPQGIAVDPYGNLYVADTVNNTIRMSVFLPVIIGAYPTRSVKPGDYADFTAICEFCNVPVTYQWQKDGISISSNGNKIIISNFASAASSPTFTASRLEVTSIQAADLGDYTVVATNIAGSTRSAAATLSFITSNAGRLSNLSIRSNAGTAAQTLIVGLVVGGAGTTGTKPLLIRGAGPALGAFGVPGFLADPSLSLFSGTTVVSSNDNWSGDAQVTTIGTQLGAFPFTSTTSKDAALYSSALNAGAYTVQITGVGGTTGVALAEIYDATPTNAFVAETPRLINVSARTQVGTGADILITGFTIGGTTPKTLLIRAVGPTLSVFGVAGVLADPKLELYSGSTLIQSNDNWGGGANIASTAASVGAFGLDGASKDAVLLVTLPPGGYTAQVSGVGNTTGVAIIEIYDVP